MLGYKTRPSALQSHQTVRAQMQNSSTIATAEHRKPSTSQQVPAGQGSTLTRRKPEISASEIGCGHSRGAVLSNLSAVRLDSPRLVQKSSTRHHGPLPTDLRSGEAGFRCKLTAFEWIALASPPARAETLRGVGLGARSETRCTSPLKSKRAPLRAIFPGPGSQLFRARPVTLRST